MIDPPANLAPPPTSTSSEPTPRTTLLWPHAVQLILALVVGVLLTHLLHRSFSTTTPAPLADASPVAPTRIDLNQASSDDLLLLPGIGPTLAERVIEHRQRHGPFRHVDELRAVGGIGPTTLQRLRPLVYVDNAGDASPAPRTLAPTLAKSKKEASLSPKSIDLNRASVEELQKLPLIGPKLAQRIVDHRTLKGPFAAVQDVRKVSGIGPKTFERIRPYVSLGRDVDSLASK
jgi:competence protein ComEA